MVICRPIVLETNEDREEREIPARGTLQGKVFPDQLLAPAVTRVDTLPSMSKDTPNSPCGEQGFLSYIINIVLFTRIYSKHKIYNMLIQRTIK